VPGPFRQTLRRGAVGPTGLITLVVAISYLSFISTAVRPDPAQPGAGSDRVGGQAVQLIGHRRAAGDASPPADPGRPAAPRQHLYVATNGDDRNPGTRAKPFKSINKAASLATPGTEVRVASGRYPGPVKTTRDGDKNARISFVSEKRWGAEIIGGDDGAAAWQNDGDYVDVVGFDISGDNEDGLSTAGSYSRLVKNRVHGFNRSNCVNTANSGYTLHDIDVIGNVVYDCGNMRLDHGIYVGHTGGTVANNIVYGSTGYGIHCWHNCNRLTITNNLVFNNKDGGIVIGQGDGPNNGSVDADGFTVANNIVVFNGTGIAEEGATGKNNKFIKNVVFGNKQAMDLQTGKEIGTIRADPKFVDYKADGSGDYRLQPSSPAVNAGTTTGAPDLDIAGNRRPQGGAVDVGAYELVPAGTPDLPSLAAPLAH
jgi:hypothetical protein